MQKVIVWGGTGNYKVVREIIEPAYGEVVALFDNNTAVINPFPSIPYMGGQEAFTKWIVTQNAAEIKVVVAIGGKYGKDRLEIQEFLKVHGVVPLTIQHSSAFVSPSAIIGEGTQIYAMAAVCTEAIIGKSCVINTAASIDHECVLGDGVFIGPGARLAGSVTVGRFADIYTGAIILPRLKIGEGAVVGAGAVVLNNVEPYTIVAGNPAKVIKKRES
ncbi:MAG: sugar acetyltransferase [Sphingobacteriales bacterium]|nr:MAG: sugar acetyltransferase [Sphingobacteriales bacterium]